MCEATLRVKTKWGGEGGKVRRAPDRNIRFFSPSQGTRFRYPGNFSPGWRSQCYTLGTEVVEEQVGRADHIFDILRIYFFDGFPVWTHGPFTSHHGNFRSEGSRGENMKSVEKFRFSDKWVLRPSAGSKWRFRMPDFSSDGES